MLRDVFYSIAAAIGRALDLPNLNSALAEKLPLAVKASWFWSEGLAHSTASIAAKSPDGAG
jgi:hypothetical protein